MTVVVTSEVVPDAVIVIRDVSVTVDVMMLVIKLVYTAVVVSTFVVGRMLMAVVGTRLITVVGCKLSTVVGMSEMAVTVHVVVVSSVVV